MKHLLLGLLFFFFFLIEPGHAQTSAFLYQQLDNRNGLSNSCINDIYQDSNSLIWVGSWDGLNVYNGSSFHIFNYSNGNIKNSLVSNVIKQITEDKKQNIWISTVAGISKYNKKTQQFSHYLYNRKTSPGRGYLVSIDNQEEVYGAFTLNNALYQYRADIDSLKIVPTQGMKPGRIAKLGFDKQNRLWVLQEDGGIQAFSKTKAGFLALPLNFPAKIDNFFFVNGKTLCVSKNKELYEVQPDLKPKKILILPAQVRALVYNQSRYIFAWSSKGFGEYNEHFEPLNDISSAVPMLENLRITSIITGRENMLWFGTDGSGVIKVYRKSDYLHVVQSQPNGQPLNIPVRAFNKINGELWVGTKGSGIITIKNLGKENVSYSEISAFKTDQDLLDNCVYAIEPGQDSLIYIGSDAPGITVYDPKAKRLIKWEDIAGVKGMPQFNSVHSILPDPDGSVWLGLNAGGLLHVKLQKQANGNLQVKYIKQYTYNGSSAGPGSDVIYTLANGSGQNLIVGCRFGGLSLFNKKTERFTTLKAFSYTGSLSNNDVLSLYKDKTNRIWVGTSFGLNWIQEAELNQEKPVFRKLNVEHGLPNNTIHAINEDNSGNIWVSTNKGLAKINPVSTQIIQFKEADGLQSDEFSDNAVWKDNEGQLFFGGIYGFNYFLPEQVKTNTVQPHLLLSDLRLANRASEENSFTVLSPLDKSNPPQHVLGPQENYFELKLQPIRFSNLQKCQYAYFLKEHDKVWHYSSGEVPLVSYSSLPPGNYTLMLKWTNGEGTWTKETAVLDITIKQYFWLTLPALGIYLIILCMLGYMLFRYRKNKFIMNQKLVWEHTMRTRDEQIHQEQLNFFTNIAHELQTPLTLILGAIDRFIFKANKEKQVSKHQYFLSIVKQEASRLHQLVHELLEFRKAEAGHLQIRPSYFNVSNLLNNIIELFKPLGEQKNIDISYQIELDLELFIDKDKLEIIIFNLLSNAYKHAATNQHIVFSVQRNIRTSQLEIVIANSGCSLTDEELQNIFNKFFVLDQQQQTKFSTGIGLAFTRQLVNLLNGNITVKCENNWISFQVSLPIILQPNQEINSANNYEAKEKPSFRLKSFASEAIEFNQATVMENNKKALLDSLQPVNKKIVLIVEDDPSIRFLLSDILNEYYIVYEAGNGKEAVGIMKTAIPHLIVSDVMMPDMDGLELCKIVKSTPETCHIPFVMLTARGGLEQKIEGYELGADAYLPKPFHAEHLLVRIKKLISYQERLHELFSKEQLPLKLKEEGLKDGDKVFLESLVKTIESNLDHEELDAAFLEEKMMMSKMQLYRKLKALANMTPGELIRTVRLQQAAILLRNTNLSVSEVFYQTGFNNESYFFREFKKKYNASPNEFRASQRLPV